MTSETEITALTPHWKLIDHDSVENEAGGALVGEEYIGCKGESNENGVDKGIDWG